MDINHYGWKQYLTHNLIEAKSLNELSATVARVAIENKTNFDLVSEYGELEGLVLGKFRKMARTQVEFPKVGDWVKIEKLPNEDKAVIIEVMPRATIVARKAAGEGNNKKPQIIATNVDVAFIVVGMDQDFNHPLLNRYLAMAKQGKVKPVLILNKSDLATDTQRWQENLEQINDQGELPIVTMSAKTGHNLESLLSLVQPGISFVLIGPSGAGKSSILNRIIGQSLQSTGEVRDSDGKGRHTTTRREMFLVNSGGILIDTPGIRELENLDSEDNPSLLFPQLAKLAEQCRYRNCDHDKSKGCAIMEAVKNGNISSELPRQFRNIGRYDNKDDPNKRLITQQRRAKTKTITKAIKRFYRNKK